MIEGKRRLFRDRRIGFGGTMGSYDCEQGESAQA